jgi:hypothetical protein
MLLDEDGKSIQGIERLIEKLLDSPEFVEGLRDKLLLPKELGVEKDDDWR